MAKKPQFKYTLVFMGTDIKFEDIQVKFIEDSSESRRFWLEPSGDKWRLLISKDFIFDDHDDVAMFNRDHETCTLISRHGGYDIDIHNVIKVGKLNKRFYLLDGYAPRQMRLSYTDNIFPEGFDHSTITGLELLKDIK